MDKAKLYIEYQGEASSLLADLDELDKPRGVWNDTRWREHIDNGGMTSNGQPFIGKIGPASVDLHLTGYVRRPRWWWRNPVIRRLLWPCLPEYRKDMKNEDNEWIYWDSNMPFKEFILWPGDFVLLSTSEEVRIPDDAASLLLLRSTTGRMGMNVMNAGWADPGWGLREDGCQWTVEAFNPSPFPFSVSANGSYIQMIMFDLCGKAENPYKGRYKKQMLPTIAKEEVK